MTIKAVFQPYNRAFVTASTYSPAIGGLSGADSTCQSLAASAGLTGASSYKAFLSTDTVNAIDRLGTARGWVRMDGQPFADSTTSMGAGILWYPLAITDKGVNGQLDGAVYTGSTYTGMKATGYNCDGWTNATASYNYETGALGGAPSIWLAWGSGNCAISTYAPAAYYCFGTAYSVELFGPTPVAGRRIFLSSTWFVPGTGKSIADADGLCVSDAVAGGACASSGTCPFKAVLAVAGGSAKSRFTNQDGTTPIVRLDGVKVADSASLFWNGTLTAPISVHANRTYAGYGETRVFSGAASPSAPGTATSTCSNWSDATATTGVNYGHLMIGAGWFNGVSIFGCNYHNPLYCLEDVP